MSLELPAGLIRARLQLMLRHPYLASATAALNFYAVHADWCPTMATDGFNIYVSPEFTASLAFEELVGVVAHEVLHCVLGHPDRRGERDSWLWNVAADLATNLILVAVGFKLPSGALLNHRWGAMTVEGIYDALAKESTLARELRDLRAADLSADGHLDAGEVRPGALSGIAVPSPLERVRLREGWTRELSSQLAGRVRGEIEEEVRRAGRQVVDWRAFLARFVIGLRRDDYRLFPPSKKHIWRGIYLPSTGVPGPNHLAVAIDTSGSMGQRELSMVLAELDSLRGIAGCKLTILQCDVAIQSIDSFEAWELTSFDPSTAKIHGRGGTSLRPPFEWVRNSQERAEAPDALIYFTDGFGVFPSSPPELPCLWIVPPRGSHAFPFGEVLRIEALPEAISA